jgi:hypothetical protein
MAESPTEHKMKLHLIPLFTLTIACQENKDPRIDEEVPNKSLKEVLSETGLDPSNTTEEELGMIVGLLNTDFDGDLLHKRTSDTKKFGQSEKVERISLQPERSASERILDADLASWLDLAGMPVNHAMDERVADMLSGFDAMIPDVCIVSGVTLGIVVEEKIIANQHVPELHVQVGEIAPQHMSMSNPLTAAEITASKTYVDSGLSWYQGSSVLGDIEEVWIGSVLANEIGYSVLAGAHVDCE